MTNSTGIVFFLLFLLLKVKQTNVNRNYLIIWHLELDTVSQEQTFPVPDCELSFMKQEHRDCMGHWIQEGCSGWLGQSQTAVPRWAFVKICHLCPCKQSFTWISHAWWPSHAFSFLFSCLPLPENTDHVIDLLIPSAEAESAHSLDYWSSESALSRSPLKHLNPAEVFGTLVLACFYFSSGFNL